MRFHQHDRRTTNSKTGKLNANADANGFFLRPKYFQ